MNVITKFSFKFLSAAGARCNKAARLAGQQSLFRSSGCAMPFLFTLAVALTCFSVLQTQSAAADGRIALLLGAEKYQNFQTSRMTSTEIQTLEAALKKQGFTVSTALDASNASARAALSDFSDKAKAADFALIVVAGHFATFQRQSFFLPTNAHVRRATDLFSRGLSVGNIANLAANAKAGAILLMVTVPDIPSTVAGISMRPDLANPLPPNIVAVFSSSDKVPVSRVDSVSAQAMKDLIEAAGEAPLLLAALADSASAGAAGRVFGEIPQINLSQDREKPPLAQSQETERAKEIGDAERRARIAAENRLDEAETRAREAELRAKATEERAKLELAAALAARKAADESAKTATTAPPNAEQAAPAVASAAAATAAPDARAEPAPGAAGADIQSLQVVEALLGREQRKTIQRLLKNMGLYNGPIDAIFGDLTREAIRAFQKKSGGKETGYLTPAQFQQLIASN